MADSNIAGNNTAAAQTKQYLNDPMPYLTVTPFHCICNICSGSETKKKHSVTSISSQSVRLHYKKHHQDQFVLGNFNNISIRLAAAKLAATNGGWKEQLLKNDLSLVQTHTVCTMCNSSFGKKSMHFARHKKNNPKCSEASKARRNCIQLICGGWFPIPESDKTPVNNTPSSLDITRRMPKASCSPIGHYANLLMPFLDEASDIGSWPNVLILSLGKYGAHFGEYVKSTLQQIVSANDPVLSLLNQCADKYADHFPSIAALIPGNILGTVQNFVSASVDDAKNYRAVFSARHSYTQIKSYLHHLFAFLFIRKCPILQPYIDHINDPSTPFSVDQSFEYAFIPSLLYDLANEVTVQFGQNTWLLEHAQLYCFRLLPNGQPLLNKPGWSAGKLSSALHAVRAGICGKMATETFSTETGLAPAQNHAESIRDCIFVNMISRWIRGLRDQDRNSMNSRSILYDAMENIIIDGILFKKEIYSNLVPILYNLFYEQFESFFQGNDWKEALNLGKGVSMDNWFKCNFNVEGTDLSALELKEDAESKDIEKLCSILELTLFGLGLGAARLEQVSHISLTAFRWSYNGFYYGMGSLKKGSISAKPSDIEEHKLPSCLDRCLLLTRTIFSKMHWLNFEHKQLFPTLPKRKFFMTHLVRSIFKLDRNVGETIHVRHLFHSILNILYPDGIDNYGSTISMPGLSSMSHHSKQTASASYSTQFAYWKERFYLDFHHRLGCPTIVSENKVVPQAPRLDADALDVLKMVFSNNATFRSPLQKNAMLSVLNKFNQHRAALLPCGSGKTVLTLVPTLDAHMRGITHSMTIIVAPHINLVGHHLGHITSLLRQVNSSNHENKISVKHFTRLDKTLPKDLDGDNLPHIAVMSICAFSQLLKFHSHKMIWWYEHGQLGHIFLDEIQLIISEGTIRKEYEDLSLVATIGAPVTLLSGSLSTEVLKIIAKFLGLTSSTTPIDVISATDLIGKHFNFEVRTKLRYSFEGVVDYCKQRMEQCHVHVLCATTAGAKTIYNALGGEENCNVECIIGSDEETKKMEIANKWRNGQIKVLISSTCALVGNENSKCRHIMIVDRIYDLSNLVQAMGRLREEQGGDDSFVTQFLSEEEVTKDKEIEQLTKSKIDGLKNFGFDIDDSVLCDVKNQLSPGGYSLLFRRKGCLLKNLSNLFGGDRTSDCKRCSNCDAKYNTFNGTLQRYPTFLQSDEATHVSNPDNDHQEQILPQPSIAENQAILQQKRDDLLLKKRASEVTLHNDEKRKRPTKTSTQTKKQFLNPYKKTTATPITQTARHQQSRKQSTASIAEDKLRQAKLRCPQCNSSICDGIECIVGRKCFHCYGDHFGSKCPNKVKKIKRKINGQIQEVWVGNERMTEFMQQKDRGCVICFHPHCTERSFSKKNPHIAQKRIKGALFKQIRRGETFFQTVQRCYATQDSTNEFLANM